jgi:hypothetical protein
LLHKISQELEVAGAHMVAAGGDAGDAQIGGTRETNRLAQMPRRGMDGNHNP